MTDTPEMAEWLKRIQLGHDKIAGKSDKEIIRGLTSLGSARQMLYDDLHYDITRKQFEGLREAKGMVVEIKQEQVSYKVYREGKPTGQVHSRTIYRDSLGHFASKPV